jgi:hypothetical protein
MKKKIKSKTAGHTPTPWCWNVNYILQGTDPTANGARIVAPLYHPATRSKYEGRANAAFIVRAVNGHEALLRLVKRHREWIKRQGVPTAEDRDWARSADQIIAQDEGKGK